MAYDVAVSGDFGVTTGADTATFPANSATVQVSVDTTDDSAHEEQGSVTVTLTADTGADPDYLLGDPSTATAAVEDDDDSPATGTVTVTGTATEGETLTADTSGLTDEDGLDNAAYVYQWVRTPSGGSDADISGATSQTYAPVFADAGATLKVKVTVTDDEGHEASFTSAPTSAVAALPRPEVTVASDGDVTEGDTVTFTLTRTGDTAETLDVAYGVTASGNFGAATGRGHGYLPGEQRHGAGERRHDGRQHPRGARLGDGDADGGHGRRSRLRARRPGDGDGGGSGRRRLAGDRDGNGYGHGDGRRDADGGYVGPHRRGRTGQRGLRLPVGADAVGRQRR